MEYSILTNKHSITPLDYQEALTRLGMRESRKLLYKNYLYRSGKELRIRYHDTDIITYRPDGSIVLDTGGWLTSTTKARFNQFLPQYQISQDKSVWQINGQGYRDGMTLYPDGSMSGTVEIEFLQATAQAIQRYVKAYMAALLNGDITAESRDCWECLSGDTEHLGEHLSESFYPSSLLTQTLKVFPLPFYPNTGIKSLIIHPGQQMEPWLKPQIQRSLPRALRRYWYKHMGLAS